MRKAWTAGRLKTQFSRAEGGGGTDKSCDKAQGSDVSLIHWQGGRDQDWDQDWGGVGQDWSAVDWGNSCDEGKGKGTMCDQDKGKGQSGQTGGKGVKVMSDVPRLGFQ